MNTKLSKTSLAVGAGILVVLAGAALWMWRQPAYSAAAGPAPGSTESAAAARERGRSMRDSFIEAHRKNGQSRANDPSK